MSWKFRKIFTSAVLIGAPLFFVACTDRLPTLTDADRLPGSLIPTTIEYILSADEFLVYALALRGETGRDDSDDLIVGRDFDGEFNAHVLTAFRGFPDTLIVNGLTDEAFDYASARVTSTVADSAAASSHPLNFYLWEIAEAWDSTATWTHAETDPQLRPWTEPGGTRANLVAVTAWDRSDDAAVGDSLIWTLPGDAAARLAAGETFGLMVTLEDEPARAQITPLLMRVTLRPSVVADTTVVRPVSTAMETFVFTPEPPSRPDLLSVGGLTSDRTLLRLRLPTTLPGCPGDPAPCEPIPAAEATLNRVDLVFDAVPVTRGFRPVAPDTVVVRRLLEPELGTQAPLGPVVALEAIPPSRFVAPATQPVHFIITGAVGQALRTKQTDLGLALQVEPEASTISYAWFERDPRLRFIYTLPQRPRLP